MEKKHFFFRNSSLHKTKFLLETNKTNLGVQKSLYQTHGVYMKAQNTTQKKHKLDRKLTNKWFSMLLSIGVVYQEVCRKALHLSSVSGLTAKWSSWVCAEGRADGEGGRVGGGRGDRGGGDPVEQEPPVPWVCRISCSTVRGLEMNLCRLCWCHFNGSPLPAYAGGQQGGQFSGFSDLC